MIEVLAVLKGSFTQDFVTTGLGAACGIGRFVEGAEYVFFLPGGSDFVSYLDQPSNATAAETLKAISSLEK